LDLMARFRWYAASLLGVGAAVAGVAALRLYLRHGLPLGVLAVVLLLILLGVGFASLAFARVRLAREAVDLARPVPQGELWQERKRRLEALHAAGTRPDLTALAAVTAAREHGRAYVGRYLVATTVLVGLLGTFGGLIETLGRVGPLLDDGPGHALAELAGPLAGLHVTFGASLVAILVTLALSLAQGDLNLAEDATLALLEERTVHDLHPGLWPASTGVGAELVAAVEGLRKSLPDTLAEALRAALERAVGPVAREVGARAEKGVATIVTRLDAVSGDLDRRSAALLAETSEKLAAHAKAQATQLAGASETLASALRATAAQEGERTSQALATTLASLTAASQGQLAETETAIRTALASLTSTAQAQLTETQAAVRAALEELRTQAAAQTSASTEAARAQAEAFVSATRMAVSETLGALSASASSQAAALTAQAEAYAASLKDLAAAESQALGAGLAGVGQELRALGESQGAALLRAGEAQAGSLLAQAHELSAKWESSDRARRDAEASLASSWLAESRRLIEATQAALGTTSERLAEHAQEARGLVADWRAVTQRASEAALEDTRALREAVTSSVTSSLDAIRALREKMAEDAARSVEGLAQLRDELAASASASATRLAEVQGQLAEGTTAAAASLDQVRRQISEAAENAARTLVTMHTELAKGASAAVEDSARLRGDLVAVVETVSSTWAELRAQVAEATRAAAEVTAKGLGEQVGAATATLREALAEAGTHWGEIQQAIAAHAAAWQGSTQEFRGFAEAVLETARAEASRVAGLTETAATSIREIVHDRGQDLGAASSQLSQAAEQLGQGMRLLTPSLTAFVGETQRLSQEVALLATRGAIEESGAESELVLDELQRLGEGFERLSELVRLATAPVATPDAETLAALEAEAAARADEAAREATPLDEAPAAEFGAGDEGLATSGEAPGEGASSDGASSSDAAGPASDDTSEMLSGSAPSPSDDESGSNEGAETSPPDAETPLAAIADAVARAEIPRGRGRRRRSSAEASQNPAVPETPDPSASEPPAAAPSGEPE